MKFSLGSTVFFTIAYLISVVNSDPHLYSVCFYDLENNEISVLDSQPITIEYRDPITLLNLGFNIDSIANDDDDSNVVCIWFPNQNMANSVLNRIDEKDDFEFSLNLNDSSLFQIGEYGATEISCNDISFVLSIQRTDVTTYHMCSDECLSSTCQDLFTLGGANARSGVDVSSSSDNGLTNWWSHILGEPTWLSITGLSVSGILLLFTIIVCVGWLVSCHRKQRKAKQLHAKKAETIIDDVLDEIARYTIGDLDDDGIFNQEWMEDSDNSDSNHKQLGNEILKAVSKTIVMPNAEEISDSDASDNNKNECDSENECGSPDHKRRNSIDTIKEVFHRSFQSLPILHERESKKNSVALMSAPDCDITIVGRTKSTSLDSAVSPIIANQKILSENCNGSVSVEVDMPTKVDSNTHLSVNATTVDNFITYVQTPIHSDTE